MRSSVNAITRFGEYLNQARRRESYRVVLQFLAFLIVALVFITALGVWAGMFSGFTPTITNATRITLCIVALLVFGLVFVRPLNRLRGDRGASLVENADASFDGRVHTYLDTSAKDPRQPFLSLLARDALSVARRVPLQRVAQVI